MRGEVFQICDLEENVFPLKPRLHIVNQNRPRRHLFDNQILIFITLPEPNGNKTYSFRPSSNLFNSSSKYTAGRGAEHERA